MNKHTPDAELQSRMHQHTKMVVDTVIGLMTAPPRRMHEADDTYTARVEDRAMEIYFRAEAEFLARVQDALALTDVCKDELQSVLDAIHDYRISREGWEAKVRA